MRSIFFPFLGLNGEIPPFRMLFVSFLFTLSVDGFGFTIPNLLFAKALGLVQTTKCLKAKLSLLWTGPFKILAVGPTAKAPDGRPLADKLLFLDLPSDLPGKDSKRRVSVARCKPCSNPHDTADIPRFLPAGLTRYVLNDNLLKSPPYHVTGEDVFSERLEVKQIVGHQTVRGRGGVLAVLYKTFGVVSLFLLGSEKWTFNVFGVTSCNIGLALLNNIVRLIVAIALCASAPLSGNSLVLKVDGICPRATL